MGQVTYVDPLPYDPSAGATDESKARARYLRHLRLSAYRSEEASKRIARGQTTESLEMLAAKHDKHRQRYAPPVAKKVLRNREFLVAMILDGENRSDAVPAAWRTPVQSATGTSRRTRQILPEAVQPAQAQQAPQTLTFDPLDTTGYTCRCLGWRFSVPAACKTYELLRRMPKLLRQQTALARRASFSIELWQNFASSTEEERTAHRDKHLGRFQGSSRVPNCNAWTCVCDYEVSLHRLASSRNRISYLCLDATLFLSAAALVPRAL